MSKPEPSVGSPREAAERIVRDVILVVPGRIADRYIDAIEAALKARDETVREKCAKIQFARIVPVDRGYTVGIGSLGIKMYVLETDATLCCVAINRAIATAIREGKGS